jgi:hypothetical protein
MPVRLTRYVRASASQQGSNQAPERAGQQDKTAPAPLAARGLAVLSGESFRSGCADQVVQGTDLGEFARRYRDAGSAWLDPACGFVQSRKRW